MAKDPYRYFRIEARQLTEELATGVLRLEAEADTGDLIKHLLRSAHTLKGAARVVGQDALARHAHTLEDELEPFRGCVKEVTSEVVEACLKLVDSIRRGLDELDPPSPRTSRGGQAAAQSGHGPAEPAPDAPKGRSLNVIGVELQVLDRLLAAISEAVALTSALRRPEAEIAEVGSQLRDAGAGGLGRSLERARLELRELADGLERELTDLRQQAIGLRLVPGEAVFGDLERALRDAARHAGRDVRLDTAGGETRFDAHVLAGLRGALCHLVRNSVVHGIEDPASRASAGKPATGVVEVTFARHGQRAHVTCRDDGRGLQPQAIRAAAVEGGLISARDSEALGAQEAIDLLLRGGVSTSPDLSAVAGRGVGLDAVRAGVEDLRGEVSLATRPGRGTTVELRVPVSLSSLPAVLVDAGGLTAGVPLNAVRRVARLEASDLSRDGEAAFALVDGRPIPFAPLTALLGMHATPNSGACDAVLIERGSELVALGVSRVQAVHSLLLRSLPAGVEASQVIAGAAFRDEGAPCLVLDPRVVCDLVRAGVRGPTPVAPAPTPPILVVDDSLTTRMLERSILESAGYEVDVAVSAEDALEKALRRSYGLFVVDVEMPGMNGFEFVTHTRADPRLQHVPAILVTSLASRDHRRRGKEAGASAYIVKGEFDQQELLTTIRDLIGSARPSA